MKKKEKEEGEQRGGREEEEVGETEWNIWELQEHPELLFTGQIKCVIHAYLEY